MKLKFAYDEERDMRCLLKLGPGSSFDTRKTKTYEELLAYTTDLSDTENVRTFIHNYIATHEINMPERVIQLQRNWDAVGAAYEKTVERIFGVSIPDLITAYITVAGRYPYNMEDGYFFVSPATKRTNSIAMHELLHFYTWEAFKDYVLKGTITKQRYEDIKESLTVLLNLEFADLQDGDTDIGYPQHADMRAEITKLWNEHHDVRKVFQAVASLPV